MSLVAARRVADAVLWEGYLLYPYRASAAKNQVRWQLGVLGPTGAAEAGVGEEPTMSTEVLVERGGAVDLVLRFLQVQVREVEALVGGRWQPVDELEVRGTRWVPFHEAVPREVELRGFVPGGTQRREVRVPGGRSTEELYAGSRLVGRLVRTWWPLRGSVEVTARAGADPRVVVLRVEVRNAATWQPAAEPRWAPRDLAARASFVSTHVLLTTTGGEVVPLLDPPPWAQADADSCRHHRCWPTVVSDDEGRDAVLVGPVVLGDHPSVAPESPGDLFDATEIDELLTLRVLTLTPDEQAAARGTDPRAAAVLDRCQAMTAGQLARLHGARRDPEPPWWDEAQDSLVHPDSDTVVVSGTPVSRGSRVRLHPAPGGDAQDMFLDGLVAVVGRVVLDVDGGTYLGVTLEDDPAAELYGGTGRYRYFRPDEVDPL